MDNSAGAAGSNAANADASPGQDNTTEESGSASFKSYMVRDACLETPCSTSDHRPAHLYLLGLPIMGAESHGLGSHDGRWSFLAIAGLRPRKDRHDFQQFPDGRR